MLKIIRQPKNYGTVKNVNSCLRLAAGDYIVRLDSDDYLSPIYIEKLGKSLYANPSAGYAHAAVQVIDESGNFLGIRKLFRKSALQSATEAIKASIKGYRVTANILMKITT